MRIVVAQRGWVFAGRYTSDGDEVVLSDAVVIRRWGTSRGLGELAQAGPTPRTVLDPAGTVHIHRLAIVAELEVAEGTTWMRP